MVLSRFDRFELLVDTAHWDLNPFFIPDVEGKGVIVESSGDVLRSSNTSVGLSLLGIKDEPIPNVKVRSL